MESTTAEIGFCNKTRMNQTASGRYRRIYNVGSSGSKERALNSSVIRSSYLPFYSARSGAVSPFGANGKPIDAATLRRFACGLGTRVAATCFSAMPPSGFDCSFDRGM